VGSWGAIRRTKPPEIAILRRMPVNRVAPRTTTSSAPEQRLPATASGWWQITVPLPDLGGVGGNTAVYSFSKPEHARAFLAHHARFAGKSFLNNAGRQTVIPAATVAARPQPPGVEGRGVADRSGPPYLPDTATGWWKVLVPDEKSSSKCRSWNFDNPVLAARCIQHFEKKVPAVLVMPAGASRPEVVAYYAYAYNPPGPEYR
jgi:hypothetical protein